MSYLALARKWRPQSFSQLIGQDHVKTALINSLNQQRLHHAYLFTGTRGVGKTSIARLFAKALNCEQGVSADPCLTCQACLAIKQGRFIDLIEVDAASRTGVEDTRALLDNVQYAPGVGRYKIYLIDEVHMLSQHSFNALLKTLEEPPEHVKFLLATTDPQKLPITVLSRCLQFSLKPLTQDLIKGQLQTILQDEGFEFEHEALAILAKAAQGSMRDALSLLDQTIASAATQISVTAVKNLLGYTHADYALQLLQALALQNPEKILELSQLIASEGGHFHYVLDELLHYLHDLQISLSLPKDSALLDISKEIRDLAAQFSPEDVQLFYQIALKAKEEINLAPSLSIGFTMAVLRMLTFRPAPLCQQPSLTCEEIQFQPNKTEGEKTDKVQSQPSVEDTTIKIEELSLPEPSPEIEKPQPDSEKVENWASLMEKLQLTGLARNAAENAEFVSKEGTQIHLRAAKGHQSLFSPAILGRIEEELSRVYNEKIKLRLTFDAPILDTPAIQKEHARQQKLADSEQALAEDQVFQQIKQEFSAELVKNSITPVE